MGKNWVGLGVLVTLLGLGSMSGSAASAAEVGTSAEATAAICIEVYVPVCGTKDGKRVTYSNECFATLDHATEITNGACDGGVTKAEDGKCPLIFLPVCGKVGGVRQTFSNACFAGLANATDITLGSCEAVR